MAFRLKFSSRALREIGEAREWYELQSIGLGEIHRRNGVAVEAVITSDLAVVF